jgi:hypothetical protein
MTCSAKTARTPQEFRDREYLSQHVGTERYGQWVRCQSSESHKNNQVWLNLMSWSMDTKNVKNGHEGNGMSKPNCLVPSQKFHAVKRLEILFRFVSATAWQSHRPGLGQPVAWSSRPRPDCYCSSVDSAGLAAHRGWLAGTAPSGAQCAADPEVVAYADCHHLQQHRAWTSNTLCRSDLYPAPRLPERNSNNISVCTDSVRLQKINRIEQAA